MDKVYILVVEQCWDCGGKEIVSCHKTRQSAENAVSVYKAKIDPISLFDIEILEYDLLRWS